MSYKRQLIGNWYLKRNILGYYKVMVHVQYTLDENNQIQYTKYEKAKDEDMIELGILCV